MSINLHLCATVKAISKIGEHEIRHSFNLWQTPDSVTYSILSSDDKLQGYKDWIKQYEKVEKIPIYASNDFFQQGDPIGYEDENRVQEHIQELEIWLNKYKDWEIEWYAL